MAPSASALPDAGLPTGRSDTVKRFHALHHTQTPLRVEWVREPAGLARHADQWKTLEQSVEHTHLSTYDFSVSWYQHYAGGYGGEPLACLAWRGESLAGVAPFAICRGRVGGVPVTRIELAPTDVPAGEVLAADGDEEVIGTFIDALVDAVLFDLICLDGFAPDSRALQAAERAARRRGLSVERDDHAYAVADLSSGYERYRAGLSGHARRNLNQRARRIAAAGGAAVEGIEFAGERNAMDRCVSRVVAITEASHKLQGGRLGASHRAFLADIMARLSGSRTLYCPILTIGGEDAAFILGVVDRGVFYDITLAYDDRFARLSPGSCLMQKSLERLASIGVHTVVSHGAHDYKTHWATRFVPQTRLLLFNRSLRGRAARFARFSCAPVWQRLCGGEQAGADR